jgi:hypothetical protein
MSRVKLRATTIEKEAHRGMSQEPESAAETRRDVAFALAMIGAGAATIWGLRNQPKAQFDPVGAAAIPVWTAWIVIGLAALLLLRIALGKFTRGDAQSMFTTTEAVDDSYSVAPDLSVWAIALSITYVALIPFAGFMASSIAYMMALGWVLGDRTRRSLVPLAAIALAGGAGIDLGFRALLIDLP